MHRYRLIMLSLVGSCLLSACAPAEPDSDVQASREGREETRNIRNTEHIGYSGDAIADRLDASLDANEQRQKDLEQADQY